MKGGGGGGRTYGKPSWISLYSQSLKIASIDDQNDHDI